MTARLERLARVYGAIAATVPKLYLAYSIWVWMEFVVQILAMAIYAAFWRAVYASAGGTLGGLGLAQTLNYILLAQIVLPLVQNNIIFHFGFMLREGQVAVELVRPFDFQARYYVESLASLVLFVLLKIPVTVVAVLLFGLELPRDPAVWAAFALALVLGNGVVFFFDYLFACLAFYSTETWGLSVVRSALATFFSGALVPLNLMPGWLQAVAAALPFAQGLYAPLALLSGIVPLSAAPQIWAVQAVWLVGLVLVSRLVFALAVRQITVQGG